ncbi:MAG: chromosome segregation protein SMC [Pseudobacteriovorax sp.]|nr:chromosome segregation protein SMC [Pseudobacteriovorax sp.]
MQLKKLVVSGFKSFADRVTLNFDDGITGIVGPNGSGKSNVIDAVRWVMGEQNAKHLRGQVATDIIFAGSDKRKALGMAEVTLVFDNASASPFCPPEYRHELEILLTRRLYVDGQREYFINKKPCRLKDIVGFFAASGLGGRSYSMIQQGQVDRILNAKPEDVREILEEAAGTMVFKNRRLAATKKLETTQENLSRIDDIIDELQRQVSALESQVAKAKQWQTLQDELKTTELKLFSQNFISFTARLQESSSKYEKDQDQLVETQRNLANLEVQAQKLQKDLAESDPELDQLREDISMLREQIARAEGTISSSMVAVESGEKRLIDMEQSLDNDQEGLELLRSAVEKNMTDYDQASTDLTSCQAMIETLRSDVEQVEESAHVFSNRSEDLDDQLRNLDRLLESNGLRCEAIERERQRISGDLKHRRDRFDNLTQELSGTDLELATANTSVETKQEHLDAILEEKQVFESRVLDITDKIEKSKQDKELLRESYLESKSQHQSLVLLEEASTSLAEILENVEAKQPSLLEGVSGILSDMLNYSDSSQTLPKSVQSGFESWAERLVIKNPQKLDEIAAFNSSFGLGSVAVSLLQVDKRFQTDIDNRLKPLGPYLRNTAGFEDIDLTPILERLFFLPKEYTLSELNQNIVPGLVIFTEDGLVCNGDFDFSISSLKQGQGRLSRRKEISRHEQIMTDTERDIQNCDASINDLLMQKEEVDESLVDAEERVEGANREALDAISLVQSLKQTSQHQQDLLSDAESTLNELNDRDKSLLQELAELGETRIKIGQEKEDLALELETLRDEYESIGERKDELNRMLQAREIEIGRLETRVSGLKENLDQNTAQLERAQGGMNKRQEERLEIENQIKEAELQKAQCHQEMETYLYRRDQLEEELNVRREKSSDILEGLKDVEAQLKEVRKQESELNTSLVKGQSEIDKLRSACKDLLAQSEEKYHVNLMDEAGEYDPEFDAQAASKIVQKIKAEIEGLGAINMIAIDEYNRLQERFQFIHGQREEVTGSIMLLEEAITEIEDTSREKFTEIFDVVNKNFQDLFPILFPGGEAKLHLTNPEDVLNAGVEIMVRMPGKTPRNMTLYSGGEKALTAISLIFALLKTKPTPFCFLDEVDAPLDEANVGRYNKVLTALADRFQFIVITHNRRTMEVLDQLYGVTMQEGGVSTVLGVDMKKDLPKHLQKAFKEEESRSVEGATQS